MRKTGLAERVDGDAYVLTVSSDGMLRGVTDHDPAPLRALVRVEVYMTEIVERLDDLGDTVAGLDAAEAGDKAEVMVRLRALADRVGAGVPRGGPGVDDRDAGRDGGV